MVSINACRGLVVLSAAAVATAGLTVPAIAAEGSAPDQICTTTTTGSTNWNVKESFNNYLEGFASAYSKHKGGIEVSGGLVTTGEKASRTFEWPVSGADVDSGTVSHGGGVHYTGHNHYTGDDESQVTDNFILDTDFSNPTVQLTGETTGRILVDFKSRESIDTETVGPFQTGVQTEFATITFATPVDLTADGNITATGTAVLTGSGADAFGGFYPEGSELSTITLNLTNTTNCVEVPEEGEDDDSATGSSDGSPLGIIALLATVGGIGAALFGWLTSTGLLAF